MEQVHDKVLLGELAHEQVAHLEIERFIKGLATDIAVALEGEVGLSR